MYFSLRLSVVSWHSERFSSQVAQGILGLGLVLLGTLETLVWLAGRRGFAFKMITELSKPKLGPLL